MSSQPPRPVSEPLPCGVLLTLHKQYGLVPTAVSTLGGGHQSNAFRLDCGAQRVVLKLGPCWRSSAELEWSYTAAEHVAQAMAVAAIPLRTTAKARVVRVGGRPMTVWPYVEGRGIDVLSDKECDLTAAVLGRMQARLATWRGPGARPATSPFALAMRRPARVPEALRDAGLDCWLTRWRAGRGRLQGQRRFHRVEGRTRLFFRLRRSRKILPCRRDPLRAGGSAIALAGGIHVALFRQLQRRDRPIQLVGMAQHRLPALAGRIEIGN